MSEPPKERFDRVIVDKKIANREGHLKDLRKHIKKVRELDQKVDEKYFAWQKAQQKGRKEALEQELKKLNVKLQEMFAKFYYKQKVIEEMIVVAGNIYEKFQASIRRVQDLEAQRVSPEKREVLDAEQQKIQTLELFSRMPREDFHQAFGLNGADDKHIATVDEEGVALAAIQGLNQKLEAQVKEEDAEIENLKRSVAELKQLVQSLADKK